MKRIPQLLPLLILAVPTGCDRGSSESAENAAPSPNASILPAPLTTAGQPMVDPPASEAGPKVPPVDSAGRLALASSARVPTPAAPPRLGQAPEADPIAAREIAGISLEGEWHMADLPGPPKAPEVNLAGLEAARKLTALKWTIDVGAVGRLRVAFDSR